MFAPPRTVPVELDFSQWIREVLTVAIVMRAAAWAIARSPLNPAVRDELEFGGRTWVVAFILALIVPLPGFAPVSFLPWRDLSEVEYDFPVGLGLATAAWLFISVGIVFDSFAGWIWCSCARETPHMQQRELDAIAERLRVSPEVLAGAVLRDLLSQPDQQFELAAKTVLSKNAELYRRLA